MLIIAAGIPSGLRSGLGLRNCVDHKGVPQTDEGGRVMHWHWYDIVFVLIALSIISDMNKPKEPKPPKVADLFPSIRLAAKAERRARRAAAWKEWRAALLIISGALAFLVLLLLIKAPENLL
jgi:hypothetical protein